MEPDSLSLEQIRGHLAQQFCDLVTVINARSQDVDLPCALALALRTVPAARHCALTWRRGDRAPTVLASTGPVAEKVERLQTLTGQGPTLEAAAEVPYACVADLATDPRWPDFALRCLAVTPVRSALCLRLPLRGQDAAALSMYSQLPDDFTQTDLNAASMFAPIAALAVQGHLHQQDVAHLEAALATSRVIGTAIGVVMARERVTSEEAFERLRLASMDLNTKLHDIAAQVAWTGAPPPTRDRDAAALQERGS